MTTPGERISAIEARLEYLATKAEVAEARGELKEGLARVNVKLSVVVALVPVILTALGVVIRNWLT